MHHAKITRPLVLLALLGGAALAGCELIVDFDRSTIPVEDAGVPDATTPPPVVDAGGDAADAADDDAAVDDAGDGGDSADDAGDGGDADDDADAT